MTKIFKDYSNGLDNIQKTYDDATKHIQDVSVNALGYLPTKFETYKKAIKVHLEKDSQNAIEKLKYFEFDRIVYTQRALLHYLNA
jgi:hypothetical protein